MFSVIIGGEVKDISYKKLSGGCGGYNALLGNTCIAQLFPGVGNHRWTVVVVGETDFLRSVSGLATRIDGVIYALRALEIGAYAKHQ